MREDKSKGELVFVPSGGLGNRLRAVASAYHLSIRTGVKLRIYWFQDWALHAPFHSLFQPSPLLDLTEGSWPTTMLYDRPRRRNFFLPKIYQRWRFTQRIDEQQVTPLKQQGFDFEAWASGKRSYMSCYQDFGLFPDALYSELFHPVEAIERVIAHNMSLLGSAPPSAYTSVVPTTWRPRGAVHSSSSSTRYGRCWPNVPTNDSTSPPTTSPPSSSSGSASAKPLSPPTARPSAALWRAYRPPWPRCSHWHAPVASTARPTAASRSSRQE